MSAGNTPRDDAELEAFLARQSSVSVDYDNLELVEPPAALDAKVLAAAKAAAQPAVTKPAGPKPEAAKVAAGATVKPLPPKPAVKLAERVTAARTPVAKEDDDDDDTTSFRRPRWLLPTALAASVLAAVGIGVTMLGNAPSGSNDVSRVGSLFARRAQERKEADKAAAEAAAQQDAEVVVLNSAPLPPPPVFEPEGPQVQDLDAAIALIRKELLRVNQTAATAEESAAPAGATADTTSSAAPAAATSVIQPRDRRLTKILELYDGGNPDLAADSLEIFLRDFEDDPISQRILAVRP